MRICKFFAATFLVAAFSISSVANAALVGRLAATSGGTDYQAYYDDVADLTWLADANATVGSAYDTYNPGSGRIIWTDANSWATDLSVGGVDGWRLADTLQPDASCDSQSGSESWGYNCTGSEMGNLFYNVLGNTADSLNNTGPFSNVQSSLYWSATEYAPGTSLAWVFNTPSGYQALNSKVNVLFAWAVHTGDVGAVPVPAAVWLFASGLIGLIGIAKRKKA